MKVLYLNEGGKKLGCNSHFSATGIPVDSLISGIKFVNEHLFSLLTELRVLVEDFFYNCDFHIIH